MLYNTLGKTGISVSRICYGSLTVGPLQANLSPEAAGEIIAYAFAKGINFIDSAQLYKNYPHIRSALKKAGSDVVISTKCYAYDRAGAVEAVEEARKLLDRDVIDIFMLHEQESIHTLRGHEEALETFYNYKAKGIIRAVGASMHHVSAVYGAIERGLDVIHPMMNITGLGIVDGTREDMEIAVEKAHDAGIGVFTMKAIGGGNLFKRAGECLAYAFDLPYADSTAIGMQSEEEIDANIMFLEKRTFSSKNDEILQKRVRKLIIDDWCIGCGKCAEKCFQKAIIFENGTNRPLWNGDKCVFCGYCGTYCPVTAIKVI